MEAVMTVLTDKQESFIGTVRISSMTTHWARKAGVVGINLDGHRRVQKSFVSNHALQLGKGPLSIGRIGLPLTSDEKYSRQPLAQG